MIGKCKYNAFRVTLLLFLSILLYSCSSVQNCKDSASGGNVGSIINSVKDEFSPVIIDDTLFFTSTKTPSERDQQVFAVPLNDFKFGMPEYYKNYDLNDFRDISRITYCKDAYKRNEYFFAAISPVGKGNRDLFSFKTNFQIKPEKLPEEINSTDTYETHPAISPDGTYMVFASDRPDGLGETDLYISFRQNNNEWSKPVNLGKGINTEQAETAPYIAPDGTLYYSSKGYGTNSGFDIIKATPVNKGEWKDAAPLPYPINTEFDELTPSVYKQKILLASNRPEGCGGYDIYSFNLCGPAIIEGKVKFTDAKIPVKGVIELMDAKGGRIRETQPDLAGNYKLSVNPDNEYLIKYSDSCLKDKSLEHKVYVPCSDSSAIKIIADFNLTSDINSFSFEKYNVPFFVSGYYLPNTKDNLVSLHLKFDYNLLGNDDSTRYIERPGAEYEDYAKVVEQALSEASAHIIKQLERLNESCFAESKKIEITITGYADPRTISEAARYDGINVYADEFALKVERGDKINNEILSVLRAYYTYKAVLFNLEKDERYNQFKSHIVWKVEGKGIDSNPSEVKNELKRRVSVKIGVI